MTHVIEHVLRNMDRKTVDVSTTRLLDSCRKRGMCILTGLRSWKTYITVLHSPVECVPSHYVRNKTSFYFQF